MPVAIFAAVDLYLALYPMTVLWKLKMSVRNKIGCSFALGLGVTYEIRSDNLQD